MGAPYPSGLTGHMRGPLYLLFSNAEIYQSRIPREATVRSFYEGSWQPSNTLATIMGWSEPLPPTVDNSMDNFVWTPHPAESFSVSLAWNHIRRKWHPTPWHSFVWDRHIAPRHAFLLWLITLNRLPTQVFLLQNRRIDDALCAFCGATPDSINHLFFGCASTCRLASLWATNCRLPWRNRPWQEHILWAMKVCGGSSFAHRIARFSFGALCHIIWTERNNAIFRNKSVFIPGMRKHLFKVVKDKAISMGTVEDTYRNRIVQRKWDLPPSIFD
ncbi:uncharacterized protein LOC130135632 [Syzygium oleosum]|uniref:uncharacterized protein LOC130135632 n=1 Tax=Syzygium oleosum TaxID=219896 RepID=UPI0024BB47B9|nr:uncharacterized protein LOC130135632 [Syzygium oleosum]